METYHKELTVLLNENAKQVPTIDRIREMITALGGKITNFEEDGKKRLAYMISGQDFAVYYFFEIETQIEEFSSKMSSWLNVQEPVLRYLLIGVDNRRKK